MSIKNSPDGYRKVVKSSGMNCVVDVKNGRQFLPDDLALVNGVLIGGEWYVPYYNYPNCKED